MAQKRRKSNSSKARRLRYLIRMKKVQEDATVSSIVPKVTRPVRYKKVHVTSKQYTINDPNEAPSRAVVTTSCLQLLANLALDHGKACPNGEFSTMRLVNRNIQLDCTKCKRTFVVSQESGTLTYVKYEIKHTFILSKTPQFSI